MRRLLSKLLGRGVESGWHCLLVLPKPTAAPGTDCSPQMAPADSDPPVYLDSEAFCSGGSPRVMQAVVPPPACVCQGQQQVCRPPCAGIILAQRGRCLGD